MLLGCCLDNVVSEQELTAYRFYNRGERAALEFLKGAAANEGAAKDVQLLIYHEIY
jgi:hypothetical protein